MIRVQRACRPRCVHEFVVKTLLNVVDNPLFILGHGFGEQAYSRAFFDDDVLKARPDSREHIPSDKDHHTFLVSISHTHKPTIASSAQDARDRGSPHFKNQLHSVPPFAVARRGVNYLFLR
jgi:hypothetical protein